LFEQLREKFGQTSETVGKAFQDESVKPHVEKTAEVAGKASEAAKAAFDTTMNASQRFTSLFNEDRKGRWQPKVKPDEASMTEEQRAEAKAHAEFLKQEEIFMKAHPEAAGEQAKAEEQTGLVVRHDTAWDRFGARMNDMPFLNSVYDSPLFDRLFGETEVASSIREMKLLDPGFSLSQLTEEVEETLAPHLVQCYLEGDDEQLKSLCGEAAFTVLNQSIVERRKQRVTLDPTILAPPRNVELRACKIMENSAPLFIYGFETQQINCLRNDKNDVVDGAVDDIRSVHYLMVVTKAAEEEDDVDAPPWIVNEVAIVAQMQAW
jgi:import inner membrane translocase subunit TIM44